MLAEISSTWFLLAFLVVCIPLVMLWQWIDKTFPSIQEQEKRARQESQPEPVQPPPPAPLPPEVVYMKGMAQAFAITAVCSALIGLAYIVKGILILRAL